MCYLARLSFARAKVVIQHTHDKVDQSLLVPSVFPRSGSSTVSTRA